MRRLSIGWAMMGITVCSTWAASPPPTNLLLLCVDDLRPELACFGVDFIQSPNIDRLAAMGRPFSRHYVQAPTCGASRFALLTGRYGGASNGALFDRRARMAENPAAEPPSMPAWFRRHGYTTVSVGKVSHHPGGRGGPDWSDETQPEMPDSWDRHLMPVGPWRHPRGAMHGLAHGEIRGAAGDMDVLQSEPGDDDIYPDGLIVGEALRQLETLAAEPDRPFFLAVGLIRPHLPFGAPARYLEPYREAELPPILHPDKPSGRTTWHASGEFMKYNRWGLDPNVDEDFATRVRKHYAACVSYADAQVGRILDALWASPAGKHTVVVLWGDHGWHLGEHGIWGKHALFEESLRSPAIVYHPGMVRPGVASRAVVETIDLFPTLCELTAVPTPDFVHGASLVPQLRQPETPGHTAVSYTGRARTLRTDTHRLILHRDGYMELYDHQAPARETANLAATQPDRARTLRETLERRWATTRDRKAASEGL